MYTVADLDQRLTVAYPEGDMVTYASMEAARAHAAYFQQVTGRPFSPVEITDATWGLNRIKLSEIR